MKTQNDADTIALHKYFKRYVHITCSNSLQMFHLQFSQGIISFLSHFQAKAILNVYEYATSFSVDVGLLTRELLDIINLWAHFK